MKLLIINGPNINLVGKREPDIYGNEDFEGYFTRLKAHYLRHGVELDHRQSNVEGELINFLHQADGEYDGVILNAGGYSHTSVALADAVRAIGIPVAEVHISNIAAREDYRRVSLTGAACRGTISGFGLDSYRLAVESFLGDRG